MSDGLGGTGFAITALEAAFDTAHMPVNVTMDATAAPGGFSYFAAEGGATGGFSFAGFSWGGGSTGGEGGAAAAEGSTPAPE